MWARLNERKRETESERMKDQTTCPLTGLTVEQTERRAATFERLRQAEREGRLTYEYKPNGEIVYKVQAKA
jgi:hypothetical protein